MARAHGGDFQNTEEIALGIFLVFLFCFSFFFIFLLRFYLTTTNYINLSTPIASRLVARKHWARFGHG